MTGKRIEMSTRTVPVDTPISQRIPAVAGDHEGLLADNRIAWLTLYRLTVIMLAKGR